MSRVKNRYPRTLAEAVDKLMATMSDEDRRALKATPREELIGHHLGLGSYIRNEFGLWKEESELLHSLTPGSSPEDPDDASLTILEALWTRLQR
ncbi:MAG: hypothetical protein OEW05_10010 [Candidatus Aminicenantes bacterium]|nr:hypothetical protein [Candidatus Aminicenantes bacterium]